MTRIPGPPASTLARHLAAAADLAGDADGVADPKELSAVAADLQSTPVRPEDGLHPREDRRLAAQQLLASPEAARTLSPELQALPAPLRRLAIEVDSLWGDADGKVSAAEIDRVAGFYLSALPMFTKEAGALLELAEHLKLSTEPAPKQAHGMVDLRAALARVDADEVAAGAPFRQLFDEALAQAEVPGVPSLLRDVDEHSPYWHSFSILEHSARAVESCRALADAAGLDWLTAGAVMLVHDVGKIIGRRFVNDEHGARYNYAGHEDAGADWLRQRGLHDEAALFHVTHHGTLRDVSAEEMIALAGGDKRLVAESAVVYVADNLAKGTRDPQLQSFEGQVEKIRTLCEYGGLDADVLLAARERFMAEWYGPKLE